MPDIPYDASRDALYSPQLRPTVFTTDAHYELPALCAELSRLAYIHFEDGGAEQASLEAALALVGFNGFVSFIDTPTGTQGYGAWRSADNLALLAFRGTEPNSLTDLGTDLNVSMTAWPLSSGHAHAGFARAALSVFEPVKQWLSTNSAARKQLVLTGHSLGAAIATLLASALKPDKLITIGSPRIGDSAFAETLDGIDITRFVDCCDVVAELPPELGGYVHVGLSTYIDRSGALQPQADAEFILSDQLAARADFVREYAWKTGNNVVRDLADHAPINYVRSLVG